MVGLKPAGPMADPLPTKEAPDVQLNNVVKKVTKAADKLGLEPGEEIRAACTTNPKGTMKRAVGGSVGGVVGALVASRGDRGGPDGGGLAERFPTGQHFLVVTDRRLLACSTSAMSGKPKEVAAQWTLDEVAAIVTDSGKLAVPMSIGFADGSSVAVEAARGTGADTLAPALEQAQAQAAA